MSVASRRGALEEAVPHNQLSCGAGLQRLSLQTRPFGEAGRACPNANRGIGRDAEAVSKLRNRRFLAPEARRIVAPGEALFASPGVADKSGMSPERAIEKEFLSPLQACASN